MPCCTPRYCISLLFAILMVFMTTAAMGAGQQGLDHNHELLLDLRLDGQRLGSDLLGYQHGNRVLLSLRELSEGLGLPINVDAEQGMAGGWYIEPSRDFAMDLGRAEVISSGSTHMIAEGEVIAHEGDLFVVVDALERWLPLSLEVKVRELALNIIPREPLPIQAGLLRRQRSPVARNVSRRPAELPLQPEPYRLLGPHTSQLRIGYSTARRDPDAKAEYHANYALLARGDLGWMTSTLSLAGHADDRLSNARLLLERTNLNGPLSLKHFEIGDISLGGSRGVLLRGGNVQGGLAGRFADERIDLPGTILPGWEVELYHNGILLESQRSGDDGRYLFRDVPLEFGENRFEFIFHGPFGEEQREEAVHYVGPDMLGVGRVSYELAAMQAGRSVFDIDPASTQGDRDSAHYTGKLNLGLTRHLTAGLGLNSFEQDGERLHYYDAGLGLAFAGFQASTRYYHRPDSLDYLSTSLRTRIRESSINLGYSHYRIGGLDPALVPDNRILWQGNLGITARAGDIPIHFTALHREQEYSADTQASLATTVRTGTNGRFSKSFYYLREAHDDPGLNSGYQFGGSAALTHNLSPWRFRFGTSYALEPESRLQTLTSSAALRMDRNMTINFDLWRDVPNHLTTYQAGFNWLLEKVQISPRISYDSKGRWVGLISASTSMTHRPGSPIPVFDRLTSVNSGTVEARVFMDHEGDGAFGEDSLPVEGVRIQALQSWRQDTTDDTGSAYLTRLDSYRQTDIVMDTYSIDDQELRPAHLGRSVIPRPGSYTVVDFPLIRTMELEGHIRSQKTDGSVAPLARAQVALLDSKGELVARQRTAFDGFYLFTGIAPGRYQLRLEAPTAVEIIQAPEAIQLSGTGGVLRQQDFLLRPLPLMALTESSSTTTATQASANREPPSPVTPATQTSTSLSVPPVQADTTPGWHVQLAAFSTANNARTHWYNLSVRFPELLTGYQPQLETHNGLTRLLTAPAQTRETANALCQALKNARIDCLVRHISHR